jgi:nucleotidyltransferase/DNA polymerase involved in DNA repair
MASIQDLKKDVNTVLSSVIDECTIEQLSADDKKSQQLEKIIDESIVVFDTIIEKINQKKVENRAKHLKAVKNELQENANRLLEKIAKL